MQFFSINSVHIQSWL